MSRKYTFVLLSAVMILSMILAACAAPATTAAPAATKAPEKPAGKYTEAPMLAELVKAGKLPAG